MENKYPFEAVVGQDKAKKALLLNLINPKIKGVLLSGEKGTGKSTLVRGLEKISEETKILNIPLNITEDRLIGGIDFEKTLTQGKKIHQCGLLKKAHENILYVDEVNLLSDNIINCILEVSSYKVNQVEREGISIQEESDFTLIGSMNPEEGELRPQFLEKFGIYVDLKGSQYLDERVEIIKRRLDFEKNSIDFINKYQVEKNIFKEKVKLGKKLLKQINLGDEIINLALKMVMDSNIPGNNVEIILLETAKAIAAYEGRNYINIEDIKEAGEYVLVHRARKENMEDTQKQKNNNPEDNASQEKDLENNGENNNSLPEDDFSDNDKKYSEKDNHDKNYSIGEIFKVKNIEIGDFKKKKIPGSGKRCKTTSDSLKGRYIKSIIPKGKVKDLAFDATLRAAAPYQRLLKNEKLSIVIKGEHIREKVREKRVGASILFAVDASGSMGANERMKTVKGAILSLLKDAYEKRDRVGMVAFRKDLAEEILSMTRSIELANKKLENLPIGGKTPIFKGLEKAYTLLKNEVKKNSNAIPILVLVTDGKINTKSNIDTSFETLLKFCEHIKDEGIKSIVIDSEEGRIKLEMAREICEKLDGKYYRLEDLKKNNLSNIIRENI